MIDLPGPVAAYFRHVNAEDWEQFREIWVDDAELTSVGGGRPRRGVDDVMAYYPGALAGWAEHADIPESCTTEDDGSITVRLRFEGVHRSGTRVEFDAVDVFRVEGDRLKSVDIRYDVDEVRAKLPRPKAG